MRQIAQEQLTEGMLAMMEVGAPVRQWVRMFRGGEQRWLTPVRYLPGTAMIEPETMRPVIVVRVDRLTLPYAIVAHHTGVQRVQLWLDTREVELFAVSD